MRTLSTILEMNWMGAVATKISHRNSSKHDDVIKWKHFPRYWSFVRGIQRSPVNSLHKGQWRGALMFSLIGARINGWVNIHEVSDLRRHRAHYDVTVMNSNSRNPLRQIIQLSCPIVLKGCTEHGRGTVVSLPWSMERQIYCRALCQISKRLDI